MKAVSIIGERAAGLVDRPDPHANGEFAVVKIQVAPMCTEYRAFKDGHLTDVLGHEAAGEVVEIVRQGRVRVGDRVVVMPQLPCGICSLCMRGDYIHCEHNQDLAEATGYQHGNPTYAQYQLKQDWLLIPIPAGMSYEHASMACCGLGPTFGAMQLMKVDAFDTVLVSGLGPVGLGAVVNARFRGARVIGIEANPYRADLARELGAEVVIDPGDDAADRIRSLTGGGVDKAVECSGVGKAVELALRAIRRKGELALVGGSQDFTVNGWRDVISKGLTLHGAWHYNLGGAPRLMEVIARSGPQLDKMITHAFPMSQAQQAFELQLTGQCGKVVLDPWK